MSDSEPNRVEQAILGALLVDNRRYSVIEQIITPDYFASEQHQKLYEMIARWIENGRLADPITLKSEIVSTGLFDEWGGMGYMLELLKAIPTSIPS